jgi:hypothetical protein
LLLHVQGHGRLLSRLSGVAGGALCRRRRGGNRLVLGLILAVIEPVAINTISPSHLHKFFTAALYPLAINNKPPV